MAKIVSKLLPQIPCSCPLPCRWKLSQAGAVGPAGMNALDRPLEVHSGLARPAPKKEPPPMSIMYIQAPVRSNYGLSQHPSSPLGFHDPHRPSMT